MRWRGLSSVLTNQPRRSCGAESEASSPPARFPLNRGFATARAPVGRTFPRTPVKSLRRWFREPIAVGRAWEPGSLRTSASRCAVRYWPDPADFGDAAGRRLSGVKLSRCHCSQRQPVTRSCHSFLPTGRAPCCNKTETEAAIIIEQHMPPKMWRNALWLLISPHAQGGPLSDGYDTAVARALLLTCIGQAAAMPARKKWRAP
jgi:hypothetical protein